MSKLDQLKALGDAKRVARSNTPEASGTAREAPSGSVLAGPSRNTVRASPPSKGLRVRTKPKSVEPIGDGVALTTIAHPPGLIDAMAEAIRSGKLSLKSAPDCPVCAARRQARTAAQKKWRHGRAAKDEK
jgi:hypothetical protein